MYQHIRNPKEKIRENMKKTILFTAAAMLSALSLPSKDIEVPGDTRTILFRQNDAQNYMVTKVFELKHLKANDLTPFILGAVKRYDPQSGVDRLNYKSGNRQYLIVTTGQAMMPFVDEMVAKMDRPGIESSGGSLLEGSGITRSIYRPRYRNSEKLVELIVNAGINQNKDGAIFRDSNSGIIYWKDSAYKSNNDIRPWLERLDRPVPQVNLAFRIYEIRESTLRDLGIDYLAWKNGPGLDFFGIGYENFSVFSNDLMTSLLPLAMDALANFNLGYGAFFCAPQFDLSFLRLLQQSGFAEIRHSATLTGVNNDLDDERSGSPVYRIALSPQYQNIIKSDRDKTSLVAGQPAGLELALYYTTICPPKDKDNSGGNVLFRYSLTNRNVVERNNYGNELTDESTVISNLTLAFNSEKLMTSWVRDAEVEQTVGMPFLSDIPGLKYLFGTTTRQKEKIFFFMTARAEPVNPGTLARDMGGQLIAVIDELNGKKENNQ